MQVDRFDFLRSSTVQSVLLVVVGLVVASTYWSIATRFVFDDAYITYRYSMNIADGFGLVWNPGQAPEEGYTSLLHVCLIAIPCLFTEDPLVAAQIINILATLITGALILFYGNAISGRNFLPLAVAALFLIAPITWANAYSGMETSLFGMLILLTFYVFFIKNNHQLGYLLALACGLTRPEGFLIGVMIGAVDIFQRRKLDRSFLLFFILPLVVYIALKVAYYGYLLPTPFIFKATLPGHSFKLFGTAYVKLFLLSVAPLFVLALIGFLQHRVKEMLLPIALAICLLTFYTLPAPLMGFHDRFLYSVFVVLFLCAATIEVRTLNWMYIPLALCFGIQTYLFYTTPRVRESLTNDHTALYRVFHDVGKILRKLPDHRQITMSTTEAGYLPFWSQLTVYDFIGLNTREFAKEKDPARNIDRLFALNPDIITLLTVKDTSSPCYQCGQIEHGMSARLHHRIPDHPAFKQYDPVTSIPFTSGVYLTVLSRKGSSQEIGSTLLQELNRQGIKNDPGVCVVSSEDKKVVKK